MTSAHPPSSRPTRAGARRIAPTLCVVLVLALGCLCESERQQVAVSPDGVWMAEVYTKECGSASAAVHRVAVRAIRSDQAFQEALVLVSEGELPRVAWKAPHELVVDTRVATVRRRVEGLPGLTITYPPSAGSGSQAESP